MFRIPSARDLMASPFPWKADSNLALTSENHKSPTANITLGASTTTNQPNATFQSENLQHTPVTDDTRVVNLPNEVSADTSSIIPNFALTHMQPALKSSINDLLVYMNDGHISSEEKAAVSSILAAIAHHTQSRLRLEQYARESEVYLEHLNQLSSSIDATFSETGSTSSTTAFVDNFLFSQTNSTGAGAFASVPSPQNTGKARVDADLSECRGLLQHVESLSRTFHDLQQRRAHVLSFLNPESTAATDGGGADARISGAIAPSSPLLSSLPQVQETVVSGVATLRRVMEQKVSALCAAGSARGGGGESEGLVANIDSIGGRMRTALLHLSDHALNRVEVMRGRITRLGSARIEEAEALERLLQSMDSYDPALTERAARRAQIGAELEDLRAWLTTLGKLRQRALDVTETLQQTAATDEDEGMFPAKSAVSSARPSVSAVVPGSLDEWRRELVLPEAFSTVPPSEAQGAAPQEVESGESEKPTNTVNEIDVTTATPAAEDEEPSTVTDAPPTSTSVVVTADPVTTTGADVSNDIIKEREEFSNEVTLDKETVPSAHKVALPSPGGERDATDNGHTVDENYEGSQFHASAFDDASPSPQPSGYMGVFKSFIGAVAQRAMQFSDSDESEAEAGSTLWRRKSRKRRRLRY